jgi:hypothetical protein
MPGRRSFRFTIIAALGVLLASCGAADEEAQAYAKAKRMSDPEKDAFLICAKGSRSNRPILAGSDGKMVMKSTPMAICACQAKSIMSIFLEKEYKSYTVFAEYMGKEVKKKPPRWSKKVLKESVKPAEAGKRLEASFMSCVNSYQSANKDLDPPLLEALPVKETDKKDEKTAKSES